MHLIKLILKDLDLLSDGILSVNAFVLSLLLYLCTICNLDDLKELIGCCLDKSISLTCLIYSKEGILLFPADAEVT